jgi:hypothetical protein
VSSEVAGVARSHGSWDQVAIEYREGKAPFLAEVSSVEAPEGAEELEEFVEVVKETPNSDGRQAVLDHLQRTRFIVANQIPVSDFEDDGFDAVGEFMQFFVERNGGMIQADGEGFYEGDRLLLAEPIDDEAPTGVGFFDGGEQFLPIPREGLLALAATLRTAQEDSKDPATDERIDKEDSVFLAETLEDAAREDGLVWMDARSRPALRWAFHAWRTKQPVTPPWATTIGELLSSAPTSD